MESQTRSNKLFVYVGGRDAGKTTLLKNVMDYFPQPKTLIVDLFDNPVWRTMKTYNHPEWESRQIPIIPLEDIPRHRTGVYHAFSNDIEVLEDIIKDDVYDTAVLMEDSSRWFEGRLTKSQRNYVLNTKQRNVDLHLVFHLLSDVPPAIVKHCNYFTLMKTHESFYDKKKYTMPHFDKAFKHVSESEDKHVHVTLHVQ